MSNKNEFIFWNDAVNGGERFETATWFRSVGLGDFINSIGVDNIAGVILRPSVEETENIIGFVLNNKKLEKNN